MGGLEVCIHLALKNWVEGTYFARYYVSFLADWPAAQTVQRKKLFQLLESTGCQFIVNELVKRFIRGSVSI